MYTQRKSEGVLIDQVKDFFAYCDTESYTYTRIYSAKKTHACSGKSLLSRHSTTVTVIIGKHHASDILHGAKSKLDFYNIQAILDVIK